MLIKKKGGGAEGMGWGWGGRVQDEKAFQAVLRADSCLNKTHGGGSGY